MSAKDIAIHFMDNPCYIEPKTLENSHRFGDCEVDNISYTGYVTKNKYYYIVKKEVQEWVNL